MAMPYDDRSIRTLFEADGFAAVDIGDEIDELELIEAELKVLLDQRMGWKNGDLRDLTGNDGDARKIVQPQLLMPHLRSPILEEMKLRERARDLARAVLGEEPQYEGEHTIVKPAQSNRITPLHQDQAFWSPDIEYNSVSVWVPMNDVAVEDGCMQFVRGSHLGEIRPHHAYLGDRTNNSFEIDEADAFRPVDCPLKKGEALVHHCRTIHGARANVGSADRVAYVFGFGLVPRKADEPRRYPWQERARQASVTRSLANGQTPTKMRTEEIEETCGVSGRG